MDDQKLIELVKSADRRVCEHIAIESPKRVLDSVDALRSRRKVRRRLAGGFAVVGMCCLLWWTVPPIGRAFLTTGETVVDHLAAPEIGPADFGSDDQFADRSRPVDWDEDLQVVKRRFEEELRELDAQASEQERLLAREAVSRSIGSVKLNWKLTF